MMCASPLPYFTSGVVVHGFGRGSKSLGIPTANFPDDVIEALPNELNNGIYYGWASLDGEIYKMVLSIGWNPFYKNQKRSMEVHILHKFSDDFYGKILKIIIVDYIRPEKDFASLDLLISEINNDIAIAEKQLEQPDKISFKEHEFFTKSVY